MKQIVLTLLFVMAAVSGLSAQEDKDMLIVYEVNGMVKTINKSKAILVKRLDSLSFASKLNIPEEGFIKLLRGFIKKAPSAKIAVMTPWKIVNPPYPDITRIMIEQCHNFTIPTHLV